MSLASTTPISVLKFGSSVLRSEDDLAALVHEIYGEVRRGHRVLAVVSAIGNTTDELLALAKRQSPEPSPRLVARLLATGESTSAALLSLALERAGIGATLLSPRDIGLTTEGGYLDAFPVGLDREALLSVFEDSPVLVLPGFVSYRRDGELALLGRGGSDLTAIFVAGQLRKAHGETRCVLVKDIDGLYEWDPAQGSPRRYSEIRFEDALRLSGDVVQHKAIRMARELDLEFEVGDATSIGRSWKRTEPNSPTLVGAPSSSLTTEQRDQFTPLRVGLIGHGTVGSATLTHLRAQPDEFSVVGVLVRDKEKHRAGFQAQADLFEDWFTDDETEFFGRPFDVLIELAGGTESPNAWIEKALTAGVHVVTANKALLAEHGVELASQADTFGVSLFHSASVGGSAPILEAATRFSGCGVQRVEAILNGTTNFVLDALVHGASLDDATRQAQERGYAEADPSLDLDGTDAAQKCVLLARAIFGADVVIEWSDRLGVHAVDGPLLAAARSQRGKIRLIATCEALGTDSSDANHVRLSVRPVLLPRDHGLANLHGIEAGALFAFEEGKREVLPVCGTGAGGWPTAEAVLADLLDLRRSFALRKTRSTRE